MVALPKMKHVLAVAGRRIDPERAESRHFPIERVSNVERDLSQLFDEIDATAVVSSAACGADLLALKMANAKGIPTRIILPFDEETFKKSSVVDRPMPEFWGAMFETALAGARARGEVTNLNLTDRGASAYSATNRAIIVAARALADSMDAAPIAVLIWEGSAREDGDGTDEFQKLAVAAGFDIRTLLTI